MKEEMKERCSRFLSAGTRSALVVARRSASTSRPALVLPPPPGA